MKRLALVLFCWVAAGAAADYADGWGPAVGDRAPALDALDSSGGSVVLEALAGEKGLVLLFVRSSDW